MLDELLLSELPIPGPGGTGELEFPREVELSAPVFSGVPNPLLVPGEAPMCDCSPEG